MGSLTLKSKWALFRLLESLSEARDRLRGISAAPTRPRLRANSGRYLWVFASTIGELNAIEPFLRRLVKHLNAVQLVLLTDHEHYEDSFISKYPDAVVRAIDHRTARARELLDEVPPQLLLLAEIPCLLSDAPCRFPFALALEAKRRGVPVCLVNGWLYRQRPSSLMDWIEKALFEREYLRLFDVMTVQDQSISDRLLSAGADPDRVFVTGNIKFDALSTADWSPHTAKSPALLEAMRASGRPVLTAGCVTNVSEQELVLDAFRACRSLPTNPLLVLAPRHPENAERMRTLERLLRERGYRFAFKTRLANPEIDPSLNCLVIDTLGELKDFYAASTVSYVGLNHNVLEPLAFGKRVIVTPGWEPIHPSFAVYSLLLPMGFITEVPHEGLQEAFEQAFAKKPEGAGGSNFRASGELAQLAGAADRCFARLEPILATLA
jgi:3-deoxy-D-manno-octulosonic-acid transferase